MRLTKEEQFNGWTAESLAAYRRERDSSFPQYDGKGKLQSFSGSLVPGNIVTEFKRGKPAMRIEGSGRNYNPFTRQAR